MSTIADSLKYDIGTVLSLRIEYSDHEENLYTVIMKKIFVVKRNLQKIILL